MNIFQTYYDAINLCGRRWTLEIMTALQQQQPMRFTDLLRAIQPTPSSKSLVEALRRLHDQGLICRPGGPDGALYQLTPAGMHLLPLLMAFLADLQRWSESYRTDQKPATSSNGSRSQ
ncbi:hypothetical protein GCM10027290_29630 [Micromonospora sonneratiae]|uniref:Winged helix-turn-helix transcriptional regulator n=1 Tax=Micromonospora sonneratiae TaxID=1184706 RepID=A0ABW3YHM9_9ACTN